MKQTRVVSSDLFAINDSLLKLKDQATRCSQGPISLALDDAINSIRRAVGHAAAIEAEEAYKQAKEKGRT